MLASASGSSYGQRFAMRSSTVESAGQRPTPAAAESKSRIGPRPRTPKVARTDPSGACTRIIANTMTDVASTTQPDTLTMSVIAPGRSASVTSKQMCSRSQSATVQSAAAVTERGRSEGACDNGGQRPRRWAGTPRLVTVSRANFGSTSA